MTDHPGRCHIVQVHENVDNENDGEIDQSIIYNITLYTI